MHHRKIIFMQFRRKTFYSIIFEIQNLRQITKTYHEKCLILYIIKNKEDKSPKILVEKG